MTAARLLGHETWCIVRGHEVVHAPDIIIMRAEFFKPGMLAPFMAQCENDRVLVVLDYDDLYEQAKGLERDQAVTPDEYQNDLTGSREMLSAAHLVTTTTPYLADRIGEIVDRDIAIVPNAINLAHWQGIPTSSPRYPLLTLSGSESHWQDWHEVPKVLERLTKRFPLLGVRIVGHQPPWWAKLARRLGSRLQFEPWVRFEDYPKSFAGSSVIWQPLRRTKFNLSRTPIRHWEAAACGAAFVGSSAVYDTSVIDGQTGYLADDPELVYERLEELFSDEKRRRYLATNALVDVRAHHALDEQAVHARMNLYYREWQAHYGIRSDVQLQESAQPSGDDDSQWRYRPLLSRDRADRTQWDQLPRRTPTLYGPNGQALPLKVQ
jgi:glycosyltransferase involved in cell wall biosynthesis